MPEKPVKVRINEPISLNFDKRYNVKCPKCGSKMASINREDQGQKTSYQCLWCEKVWIQE